MVVATGFFDGVHSGHRLVLETLVDEARSRGEESLVATFWPHPRTVLQNGARDLRLLTSLEEKKEMILALGVDRVEVLPFTKEFSAMPTLEYLRFLKQSFGTSKVILGYDNRMGRNSGTPYETAELAHSLGMDARVLPALPGEKTISSTMIRRALAEGDVTRASGMLGYEYSLTGVVVGGNRIGRTLGFPTANLRMYDPLKVIPAQGAYLVRVSVAGGTFFGMCNVADRIETNIFGFGEDIYGLDIKVSFLERIRDEIEFKSLDLLKMQLEKDRGRCMELLEKWTQ